jgi:hypothetical protein
MIKELNYGYINKNVRIVFLIRILSIIFSPTKIYIPAIQLNSFPSSRGNSAIFAVETDPTDPLADLLDSQGPIGVGEILPSATSYFPLKRDHSAMSFLMDGLLDSENCSSSSTDGSHRIRDPSLSECSPPPPEEQSSSEQETNGKY